MSVKWDPKVVEKDQKSLATPQPHYVMQRGDTPDAVAQLLHDEFFPDLPVDTICKNILSANGLPTDADWLNSKAGRSLKEGTRLKLPMAYAQALAQYNYTSAPGEEILVGGLGTDTFAAEPIAPQANLTEPTTSGRLATVVHGGEKKDGANPFSKFFGNSPLMGKSEANPSVAFATKSKTHSAPAVKTDAQRELDTFAKSLDPVADKAVLDFINRHLGHKPEKVLRRASDLKTRLDAETGNTQAL